MLSAAEKNPIRFIAGFWLILTKTNFPGTSVCLRKMRSAGSWVSAEKRYEWPSTSW